MTKPDSVASDTDTLPDTSKEINEWPYREDERLARAGTILLVEDEDFVRRVTCEVLRAAGYAVLSAKNATEALDTYDQQREVIALLLTDVVLPGESGRELARKLIRRDATLKVLFVTGYGEQITPHAENGAGPEAKNEELLAKPFSTALLLRRIAELLGPHPNKIDETCYTREHQSRRACDIAQHA
jgi:two-component system, cell cycle sensor histidine kinase and response regulator CckA